MPSLDEASLSAPERRALDRIVGGLVAAFGAELHGIWLFGSRARGEVPGPESDIDVLVVMPDAERRDRRAYDIVEAAADAEGVSPIFFAVHLMTPEHLANRREIRSFFIQEVDRDKIVLAGAP